MQHDIFFISYNESNQEKNWARVRELHPDAIRLHGITGIDVVHNTCNSLSNTDWFWTVDGDNWLTQPLCWSTLPSPEIDLVMFKATDPITGGLTSLGGVKLWHKDHMVNTDMSKGDFCLNATKEKELPEVAFSITNYNATPYEAWKTSFRHCVKLLSVIIQSRPLAANTSKYIDHWRDIVIHDNGTNNAKWCSQGYIDAGKYVRHCGLRTNELYKINDYEWLREYFNKRYEH